MQDGNVHTHMAVSPSKLRPNLLV